MHAEGWNNVPPEALTTIFLHLQPNSWQKWQLRPWVALTEVCHLWRQAALNEPALWARVPCCTPKQTEMMLSLSGNTLLDVDASEMWEHDDPYESFALIMAHWRRIRTLRYPIIPAEHSASFAWTLSERLGYPAENLQEVLITCVSKDDFAEDEDDEDEDMDEGEALDDDEGGIQPEPTPFGFLPPIPPGDTATDRLLFFPHLWNLDLARVAFPNIQICTRFRHMRNLSLVGVPEDGKARWDHLIQCLPLMRNLEILTLHDSLIPWDEATDHPLYIHPRYLCGNLRLLDIHEDTRVTQMILSAVVCPILCDLEVLYMRDDAAFGSMVAWPVFADFLGRLRASNLPLEACTIEDDGDHVLIGARSSPSTYYGGAKLLALLGVHDANPASYENAITFGITLAGNFCATALDIQNLDVTRFTHMQSNWMVALEFDNSLSMLKHLTITDWTNTSGLIDSFRCPPFLETVLGIYVHRPFIFLPALEHLTFVSIAFAPTDLGGASQLQTLGLQLAHRTTWGRQLHRLEFLKCNGPELMRIYLQWIIHTGAAREAIITPAANAE